jgi:multisubunit Na+/H+ antiporter MnhC subunit
VIAVLAVAVALLTAVGVELLLGRSLFRAILGLSLLANAANLVVLAAGGAGPAAPILAPDGAGGEIADPLPQALVLTAIVISMAVTLYLIGVMRAQARDLGSVAIEPALASDEGREPTAVAAELGAKEGSR